MPESLDSLKMNLIFRRNKNKKKEYNIMLKILFSVIQITLASYFLIVLLLYFFQKRIIFIPYRDIVATPSDIGLKFDDVYFRTQDGTSLNGWFIPAAKAEYTVLFCHGNGGNISHRLDTIALYNRIPLNFFIFDYRNYGKSSGSLSEKGLYEDIAAAWKYLTETRKIPPEKIIIVGRSLGGSIAAHAAAEFAPGGLILESTFTSMTEIAGHRLPFLPVSCLLHYKLPTVENLAKVKCPVLIIASPDDTIVPFKYGKKLFAEAPEPKTFLQLTGDHNDCYFLCRTQYIEALTKFIKTVH